MAEARGYTIDRILALDPGPEETAAVSIDLKFAEVNGGLLSFTSSDHVNLMGDFQPNAVRLQQLRAAERKEHALLIIEDMDSYGQPIGLSTMTTLKMIGRLFEAWNAHAKFITRREIKLHLCNTSRAKDANVNAAVWDRFGGSRRAAVGTKKAPGPCYGFKTDIWAALAVGVTWIEQTLGQR